MTAIMESKPLYIVTNPVQQKENHYHFYTMDHKEAFKCGLSNSKTTKASSQAAFLKKVMTLLVQNYSISWRDQTLYLSLADKTMIFNTNSQLEIEPDRLFHPKLVSLPDVDASPRRRRVNLHASIEKVYETREGKNWKGKDILLNRLNDGHSKGIKHEAVGRQECAKKWSRWRKHHHVFAKQVKSCVEEMPWFSWPEHENQSGRKFSTESGAYCKTFDGFIPGRSPLSKSIARHPQHCTDSSRHFFFAE